MSKIEIITTEEFNKSYKYYGYEELLRKVLHKCSDKKDYGLVGKITMTSAEPSKYLNFSNEQGKEYYIKYYIEDQTEKRWNAGYQLFTDVLEDGVVENAVIDFGSTSSHYVIESEEK